MASLEIDIRYAGRFAEYLYHPTVVNTPVNDEGYMRKFITTNTTPKYVLEKFSQMNNAILFDDTVIVYDTDAPSVTQIT